VRVLFFVFLALIVAGIALFAVVGLLHA